MAHRSCGRWTRRKSVMTSWMERIARPDRKDTETLQFAFLHSPDGHPVCGVVPLIVGETAAASKATCDELAAFGGGALVRQDTRAALHRPSGGAGRARPVQRQLLGQGRVDRLGSQRCKRGEEHRGCGGEALERKAGIRLEAFHVHPLHGGQWSGGQGRPRLHVLRRSQGTPLVQLHHRLGGRRCRERAASKKWCGEFVAKLSRFHVTSYLNNAMPESEAEMLGVFPQDTHEAFAGSKEKTRSQQSLQAGRMAVRGQQVTARQRDASSPQGTAGKSWRAAQAEATTPRDRQTQTRVDGRRHHRLLSSAR